MNLHSKKCKLKIIERRKRNKNINMKRINDWHKNLIHLFKIYFNKNVKEF